jgi:hypothetical protein
MGTPSQKQITWHIQSLPPATNKALDYLSTQNWLKNSSWYLAGDTALALQAGHRKSVDLDFFTPKINYSAPSLLKHFKTK